MTPDSPLYYDVLYDADAGMLPDNETERCVVCGDKCTTEHADGYDFYCEPCWRSFHLCTRCETRIFGEEVEAEYHNTQRNRVDMHYFHPGCFQEQIDEQGAL
jgi:hypothetical protein